MHEDERNSLDRFINKCNFSPKRKNARYMVYMRFVAV